MDLRGYLFTVNKNNGCRLDSDELKDLIQEVTILFSTRSLNDQLQKKTAIREYQTAVRKKIKREQETTDYNYTELVYLKATESESDLEREQRRRSQIRALNLNRTQKKIIDYLVRGFSYEEIRHRLKMNSKQLRNQVYQIKNQNRPQAA